MYPITQIAQIIRPYQECIPHPSFEIKELVYDSRKVVVGDSGLFFALRGGRDGHDYIPQAYAKGIRNFIVSRDDFPSEHFPEANFLWVADTLVALQSLVSHHRKQFDYPIIGITGSNGKTVVKQWLFDLLSGDKKVYQSPKSYNSQLGVALSLWGLQDQYDVAIIEAGISKPHEMESLERMILPDIGVLTSLGVAHAEGFVSKAAKLEEKLKLFAQSKALIYPSKYIDDLVAVPGRDVWSWGTTAHDRIRVDTMEIQSQNTWVSLSESGVSQPISIPFTDVASIENCLTCITVLRCLGYDWNIISVKIQHLKAVEMRLQLKKGIHNCSIIDDSYSNDLGSLKIALDFLMQQRQHEKKTLILSEMMGLPDDPKYMVKLVNLLSSYSFSRLIWVGADQEILHQIPAEVLIFDSVDDLNKQWATLHFYNESVLIKGGRAFRFEEIVRRLTAKSHGTVLEINLNAIEQNLKSYRSLLPAHVKLMAMVKAFSYGSGSFEVANMLQFNQVDYLTVAFVDEGVELRQGGISLPIMVLSPDDSTFDNLVAFELEPEIYSFRILESFLAYLAEHQRTGYPIHIKLDTGMHRLGFLPEELGTLIEILKGTSLVKVQSVFSHLVASGDPGQSDFTHKQITLFDECSDELQQKIGYPILRHIANTSGIVRWPEAYFDMVRLGIGLYGVDMDQSTLGIVPTSTLKTTITQLKSLKAGETVGYDRRGVLYRDSRIATVKIGYADGYDRRFGNGVGKMRVRDMLVPTVGNICMDMCMLDVTGIDVHEGDEVIVFPDLLESARAIGVIPYELLVNISSRVKRVYYYE